MSNQFGETPDLRDVTNRSLAQWLYQLLADAPQAKPANHIPINEDGSLAYDPHGNGDAPLVGG